MGGGSCHLQKLREVLRPPAGLSLAIRQVGPLQGQKPTQDGVGSTAWFFQIIHLKIIKENQIGLLRRKTVGFFSASPLLSGSHHWQILLRGSGVLLP